MPHLILTSPPALSFLQIVTMPRPCLTPRRRAKIASLARYRSYSSIAWEFNIAKSTVGYCVMLARLQALIPPALAVLSPVQGIRLPRSHAKLTPDVLRTIYEVFEAEPFASNREVLQVLAEKGISLSLLTLRRARRRLGYGRFVALVRPYLSPQHKEKRLAYAAEQERLFQEWRKVIFCDEVPLYVNQQHRAYVTRPVGSDRTNEKYVS